MQGHTEEEKKGEEEGNLMEGRAMAKGERK